VNSLTPVLVSGISSATSITTYGSTTCALLANNTVKCWGLNSSGQLGDGTFVDRVQSTFLFPSTTFSYIGEGGQSSFHRCNIKASGQVHCSGRNDYGQTKLLDLSVRTVNSL
jgi:hypothetical protein